MSKERIKQHTEKGLPYDDVEIDKVGDYWVITWWLNEDVTLRLKIQHFSYYDPDCFICEAKIQGRDFQVLSKGMIAPVELLPDWYEDPDLSEFPEVWRDEFVEMARTWARLIDVTEFGRALGGGVAVAEADLPGGLGEAASGRSCRGAPRTP